MVTIMFDHFKSILVWFFWEFTSIGGLVQFRSTNLKVSKIIWLVLFLVASILTFLNIERVISEYLARKVNTITNLKSGQSLGFPAVTICNENPVHCGHLLKRIKECEQSKAIRVGSWP